MERLIHEDKTFKNLKHSGKETTTNEFEHCSFLNCDFSNGTFTTVKFIDCVFTDCNMALTKLNHCQMNNVTFKGCKLSGVNFGDCADFLFAVKFDGCMLDYCSFVRKKMLKTSFINTSLKCADFSESDLTRSAFLNTDLMDAVFDRTILKEVDFSTATNYRIDPETNNIKKARFSLQGIIGLLGKYDIVIE